MAKRTAMTAVAGYTDIVFDATGALPMTLSQEAADIAIPRACNACIVTEEAKLIPGVMFGWTSRDRITLVMRVKTARQLGVVPLAELRGRVKPVGVRFGLDAAARRAVAALDAPQTQALVGTRVCLNPLGTSKRFGARAERGGSAYSPGKKGSPRGARKHPAYR